MRNIGQVPLSSIARIIQGGRLRLSGRDFVETGFPAYGAGGVNGYLRVSEFDGPGIILSAIGARCGKCFYASGGWTSLANTQLIFVDDNHVDLRYLWYQLNDEAGWIRSGTGQPFIKPSDVKSRLVALPTLAEQRRLVSILDEAAVLCMKRRESIAKLDQLLQAVFIDMFGDPAVNSLAWPVHQLGDLLDGGPQNGLYKPAQNYGAGTPIIRIDGYRAGDIIRVLPAKRVRLSSDEVAKYALKPLDILINRVNSPGHLGKAALVGELSEFTVFESNMMRLTVDNRFLVPSYLIKYLSQQVIRDQVSSRRKDAINQSSINQDDVKSLKICVPPLSEQEKFKTVSSRILSQHDALASSARSLDEMFNSLRYRAFAGTL